MGLSVLVTGAAGFIGSHVAAALAARGDLVIGIDNFDPYYDPERKRANVEEIERGLSGRGAFVAIEDDIRDQARIRALFRDNRFDRVVHLAGLAGVRASIERPDDYVDVNVGGSTVLLEAAVEHRVPGFVFASTSSVYGSRSRIPFFEDDACDRPYSPYAATKRAVEMLGHVYHHLHGLPFTALRFFTVYGPRNRPDMMAYKLLESTTVGTEVPLYDGGRMYRDWTFVGDIVRGILAAIDRPFGYEVLNLGRGRPVLLADFVRLVESLAGRPACLRNLPKHAADSPETYADISRAKRLLEYRPVVSIEDGVRETFAWYRRSRFVPACEPVESGRSRSPFQGPVRASMRT